MQGAKSVENGEWRGKFFAWVVGGCPGRGEWGRMFTRAVRKSSEPRWLSQAAGAFFSIECTKKRPKAFFYRMFLDVITGDTLAGKTFYAKK